MKPTKKELTFHQWHGLQLSMNDPSSSHILNICALFSIDLDNVSEAIDLSDEITEGELFDFANIESNRTNLTIDNYTVDNEIKLFDLCSFESIVKLTQIRNDLFKAHSEDTNKLAIEMFRLIPEMIAVYLCGIMQIPIDKHTNRIIKLIHNSRAESVIGIFNFAVNKEKGILKQLAYIDAIQEFWNVNPDNLIDEAKASFLSRKFQSEMSGKKTKRPILNSAETILQVIKLTSGAYTFEGVSLALYNEIWQLLATNAAGYERELNSIAIQEKINKSKNK